MKLSKAQEKAVAFGRGPALVVAGPGSGKTAVITRRIKALIDKGIRPEHILVITFTNAAAEEMKKRFQVLMGDYPVTFGTFHSIFLGIIKHEVDLSSGSIVDDEKRLELIKNIYEQENANSGMDSSVVNAHLIAVSDEISRIKANGGPAVGFRARSESTPRFLRIFKCYGNEMKKRRMIDYDDMILMTERLFKHRPDILHMWQEQYKYILIDEFQDINKAQYNVVKMLAAPRNNLFVVGDDDQSIYAFRGASPEVLINFTHDYPNAVSIFLDKNYRSDSAIVEAALRLIKHNRHRLKKAYTADRKSRDDGKKVIVKAFRDAKSEDTFIINEIKRLAGEGLPFEEIAVLYRTSGMAQSFTDLLENESIPADSKVFVGTMHRSKGLEFSVVFIPDACEGLAPYRLAKLDREIEEERRLFYVAVTRAKHRLYILSPDERFNKQLIRSRFIGELLR